MPHWQARPALCRSFDAFGGAFDSDSSTPQALGLLHRPYRPILTGPQSTAVITAHSNQASTSRTGRSALPALLVVSLLIGVTISAIKPGVRALHRDAAAEFHATRQIAKTIARAVRGMSTQHVPVAGSDRVTVATGPAPTTERQGRPEGGLPLGYWLPRATLLSLPPPTA